MNIADPIPYNPPCRLPSIDLLQSELQLTEEEAEATYNLISRGPEYDPYQHPSHNINKWLNEINSAMGGQNNGWFGCESLYPERENVYYINAGDTYATTLIYDSDFNEVDIGCWGDLVD